VACSTKVWVLICLGGADSSMGNVCTALLTKVGVLDLTFVVGQGSVLILVGHAGSCVTPGCSSLTAKVEGTGGAPGIGI
jgi:hypothetical protein